MLAGDSIALAAVLQIKLNIPLGPVAHARIYLDSGALKAKNGRVSYLIGPSTLGALG